MCFKSKQSVKVIPRTLSETSRETKLDNFIDL